MSQNNNPNSPNSAPEQIESENIGSGEKDTKDMSEATINIGDYLAGCEYEEKLESQLK